MPHHKSQVLIEEFNATLPNFSEDSLTHKFPLNNLKIEERANSFHPVKMLKPNGRVLTDLPLLQGLLCWYDNCGHWYIFTWGRNREMKANNKDTNQNEEEP